MKDEIIMVLKNNKHTTDLQMTMQLGNSDIDICYLKHEDLGKEKRLTPLKTTNSLETMNEINKIAKENMLTLYPPTLSKLEDMIFGFVENDELKNYLKEDNFLPDENKSMYVLSNKDTFYGAIYIAFPEIREKILNLFNSDVVILPSSVHEVIVLAINNETEENFNYIIEDANAEFVKEEDILSNKAYILRKER